MGVFNGNKNEVVDCVLDSKKKNRYVLTCTWEKKKPSITFIMLNPSVGKQENADPTLRRCINFALNWGYGSIKVVNIFSQITPNPTELQNPKKRGFRK
ncbi:DUF1643 domain-containing protein [Virgibacillus ndiopensis]|uniref:DUF1643 domain-containing protein n=1 Tax=Virgibacillus ndiopensis TaxID=2004408 RepID=UPI000C085172|nr:DUF1643 domain-containing protein [Virgibacillus ndiopensis]